MFSSAFYIYLWVMIALAVVVFVALYFVDAGYGMMMSSKWGKGINNKVAWFLMEFPIFAAMLVLWFFSPHRFDAVPLVFLIIFETHYFQRSLIFPWLMKGKKSKMSLGVMFMGIAFNILNAAMQGYWLFYEAYNVNAPFVVLGTQWFCTWQFIVGVMIFISGFIINLNSDYIIRHLRKDENDTNHYLPQGGMFKFVTSANYLGELIEWLGFAILTWSMSGLVFFIWTFANLVPRANAIYKRYQKEFGEEMSKHNLKRVIPFIY